VNDTLRTYAIAGAVLGGLGILGAAQIGLSHLLLAAPAAADNAAPVADVAECERSLHAAQSRDLTWTFPPFGYDYDGRPAVIVRFLPGGVHTLEEATWIVQAAECYASKGKWWDRPLNVIYTDGEWKHTIGRYDGEKVTAK
jgi:hypothetical protein